MKPTHSSLRSAIESCAILLIIASGSLAQLTSNRDGKIDKQFGKNGITVFGAVTSTYPFQGGGDIVATPDGKFVSVHSLHGTSPNEAFMLHRFHENGQPDNSFGTNGRIELSNWPLFSSIRILVDANGKILVAGVDRKGVDFMVLRLTQSGAVDNTFGVNGIFRKDFSSPGGLSDDRVYSIDFQNDGKIIVAGISDRYTAENSTSIFVTVVRLYADGTLDESFGNGGASVKIGDGNTVGYQLGLTLDSTLTSEGNVVVATTQPVLTPGGSRFQTNILRFLPNGALDPDFSGDGIAEDQDPSFVASVTGVLALENGKILISTIAGLKRFNSDGSPDPSFIYDHLAGGYFQIVTIAASENGKILIGGIKSSPGSPSGVVRRIYNDGIRDIKFGNFGETLLRVDEVNGTYITRSVLSPSGRMTVMGSNSMLESSFIARFFITRKP